MDIRNVQPEDLPRLEQICLQDDSQICDPFQSAILDVFCRWYVQYAAEDSFVAVDADGIALGYILCARDFTEWEDSIRKTTLSVSENPITPKMGEGTIEAMRPYAGKYPAHLHIDLMPDFQGQGIGRQLIATLFAHLKKEGVSGVMLNVANDNPGAMHFYEKCGFQQIGKSERETAYGKKL